MSLVLLWKLKSWRFSLRSESSCFDPLTFHSVSLTLLRCEGISHICTVRPNHQTAVSKETRAKNIKWFVPERGGIAREMTGKDGLLSRFLHPPVVPMFN